MVARSVQDVQSYRRCPLAYGLGGIAGKDGLTPKECMDISVREAIHELGE